LRSCADRLTAAKLAKLYSKGVTAPKLDQTFSTPTHPR